MKVLESTESRAEAQSPIIAGNSPDSADAEDRLKLLLECSRDGFWEWNVVTNEIYLSPRCQRMLGYAENELPSSFAAWEDLFHPVDRAWVNRWLQSHRTPRGPKYQQLECRLRHKDGSYRWMLLRGAAQRDDAGNVVRVAGCQMDVTERKTSIEQLIAAYLQLATKDEALKQSFAELKSANDALQTAQLHLIEAARLECVGTLAAGIAHEVKNPLQVLVMGLVYLERVSPARDAQFQHVLKSMREAVTHANAVVRELLDLSAAREFKLQDQDLNAVVYRALELMHPEVISSRVSLVRDLGSDLPEVNIDHAKMEQVFINLFLNALQAMGPGGVLTIRTRTARAGELPVSGASVSAAPSPFNDGDLLVVAEVQDTGSGISEADLPNLFKPFFTTKPSGTGLGLAVIKEIVEFHHGVIEFENVPSGGALARLTLKAARHHSSI